jgi:hypothetical protein
LVVVVAACFTVLPTSSFACSQPPNLTKTYSWPPSAYVGFTFNSVPSGPASTAIANWNAALPPYAVPCAPILFQGYIGSDPTVTMNWATLPPPANCPTCTTRGQTFLDSATIQNGRIYQVQMTINIAVTGTAALTEVIAHEIGHTMGLWDCSYPGCPIGSSVMESNVTGLTSVNQTIGTPGPTTCDITAVLTIAPDYFCPAPPPPDDPPPCDLRGGENTGPCSPIILDIDGKGFNLTSAAGGVLFDISGTGHPVQMAWTANGADNAFLTLPGIDGLVHNGKQLFGNFTPQPPSSSPNGFAALAVYDLPADGGNGDGVIDARDAIFSSLRLWIDTNHDGISQPEELHTLSSLGVNSISLKYKADQRTDQYGNVFHYRAQVNPGDPTNTGRMAYDVFFVTLPSTSAKNLLWRATPASVKKCPAPPVQTKGGMLSTAGTLR